MKKTTRKSIIGMSPAARAYPARAIAPIGRSFLAISSHILSSFATVQRISLFQRSTHEGIFSMI